MQNFKNSCFFREKCWFEESSVKQKTPAPLRCNHLHRFFHALQSRANMLQYMNYKAKTKKFKLWWLLPKASWSWTSTYFLNTSRDTDSTTSLGSLLQILTTLSSLNNLSSFSCFSEDLCSKPSPDLLSFFGDINSLQILFLQ